MKYDVDARMKLFQEEMDRTVEQQMASLDRDINARISEVEAAVLAQIREEKAIWTSSKTGIRVRRCFCFDTTIPRFTSAYASYRYSKAKKGFEKIWLSEEGYVFLKLKDML